MTLLLRLLSPFVMTRITPCFHRLVEGILGAVDETTEQIIRKITITGAPRTVKGGHVCTTFFDCAELATGDLARLAAEALGDLDPETFYAAVGVAFTGVFYAAAVAGGRHVSLVTDDGALYGASIKGRKVVIVDDVVYSGVTLSAARTAVEKAGGNVVGFVTIVDRSRSPGALDGLPVWSAFQAEMN